MTQVDECHMSFSEPANPVKTVQSNDEWKLLAVCSWSQSYTTFICNKNILFHFFRCASNFL